MELLLSGRELLIDEIPLEMRKKIIEKEANVQQEKSFIEKMGKLYCGRCQAEMVQTSVGECRCGEACAYCRNCINMGKVTKCSFFYSKAEQNVFPIHATNLLAWTGKLSEQQQFASNNILGTIATKETRLLWAVAGAGKTEMLFPGIEKALQSGERVCIASPRVDVCLELAPRIREAFPTIPLAVLYGGWKKNMSTLN